MLQYKDFKKLVNNEFLVLVIIVIFVCILIFCLGMYFVEGFANNLTLDSFFYFKMSYAPIQESIAPYMYRMLTPFLVYLLPFNHIMGFTLINLTGLFLTAILFYYYLKKLNFTQIECIIGVLFLLFSPTIIYTMYDIVLVDSLSFLFLLLAFYAILCKNDKLYLISLILGVLNKETILITIPLYFLYKIENEKLTKTIKSTIIISMIPIMLFVGIRYYFGFMELSIIPLQTIIYNLVESSKILEKPYLAFGTLWIVFLFSIKYVENSFLKKSFYLIPLILLQFFIAFDGFRIMALMFPILIPVTLYLFKIKNQIMVLILLLISSFSLFYYILTLTNSLSRLLVLPLEIFILSVWIIQYLNIKGILKPLISKVNPFIHPGNHSR